MYEQNTKGRKKKKTSVAKKIITNVMLAPGKMPRLNDEKTERITGFCEIAALVFTAILVLHMVVPEVVGTALAIGSGAVFGALLLLILLGEYQDKLVEYELYGFRL